MASYQGNELFFGIFLPREMSQEQPVDIRRRKRILLRQTIARANGIGNRLFLQRRAQSDLELPGQSRKRSLTSILGGGGPGSEETYVYAYIGVLVDRGWEEQKISRFASLFKLRIQLAHDLLWGEPLGRSGGGHRRLSDFYNPSLGIARGADWNWLDGSGTEEIGDGRPKTQHPSQVADRYLPCRCRSFPCILDVSWYREQASKLR